MTTQRSVAMACGGLFIVTVVAGCCCREYNDMRRLAREAGSDDWSVRTKAVGSLLREWGRGATPYVLEHLNSPDPDIVVSTMLLLKETRDPRAIPVLRRVANSDTPSKITPMSYSMPKTRADLAIHAKETIANIVKGEELLTWASSRVVWMPTAYVWPEHDVSGDRQWHHLWPDKEVYLRKIAQWYDQWVVENPEKDSR